MSYSLDKPYYKGGLNSWNSNNYLFGGMGVSVNQVFYNEVWGGQVYNPCAERDKERYAQWPESTRRVMENVQKRCFRYGDSSCGNKELKGF